MWQRFTLKYAGLPLREVREQGILFKTGVPVTFTYIHNTDPAPQVGETFQQHIEPAGYYVIHNEHPVELEEWDIGKVTLNHPLVLALNTEPGEIYGPHSWKAVLHEAFNASGQELSQKLRELGVDGIVTVNSEWNETSEIVLL